MEELNFNAFFGTFDVDMEPVSVIDITEIIKDNFHRDLKIIIPPNTDFIEYFGDPAAGKRKFIQIISPYRKFNIIQDDYQFDIEIDLNQLDKNIKIIYYAYIDRNSNWQEIISGQLKQLRCYGILDEADLYVHITDVKGIFNDVVGIIKNICKHAYILKSNQNHFEYYGIKLAYDLSGQYPESTIIYLHTKGMSYHGQSRATADIALLTGTFDNWRKNLEVFKDNSINKIGLFPALEDMESKWLAGSRGGWIWYNFWYARASYILTCEVPEIKTHRWYFEDWLGGPQNELSVLKNDCRSIHPDNGKTYYTAEEAKAGLMAWKIVLGLTS
ncbi:hypothetical protein [Pedobacter sp. WC2423]|uniref:hypothetical protein n=1 Tax=Pedobacter sp. WC2423 TaxID=3234142 RepID=UPI003467880C